MLATHDVLYRKAVIELGHQYLQICLLFRYPVWASFVYRYWFATCYCLTAVIHVIYLLPYYYMLFLFLELAYYGGPPIMPLLPRGTFVNLFLGAAWYCYYCLSLVDLYEDLLVIQN